jgi:8-oxo-dGTP pyrophosphatase MutT (NUDIX family)
VEADATPAEERQAVRAVVADGADRVLLVRFRRPDGSAFWTTPGGGVEPGESDLDALRRELREEIGLVDAEIGPCVWTREHSFFWHRPIRQLERVYLVRVDRHVEAPGVDLAAEGVDALRWWTLDDLAKTPDELAPRQLVPALRGLLAGRIPDRPYDVGR